MNVVMLLLSCAELEIASANISALLSYHGCPFVVSGAHRNFSISCPGIGKARSGELSTIISGYQYFRSNTVTVR